MKEKRAFHKEKISAHHQLVEKRLAETDILDNNNSNKSSLPNSESTDIKEAFAKVVLPKKRKIQDLYKKKNKKIKDENYIPYAPADFHTEHG